MPFGVGLLLDPRIITGAPAWLKPLKFAVSTAIYAFTLAWVFTYLPDWPRTRRIVGAGTAAAFVLEVAMIGGQAWRGTTSHFNVATPFDAAVFGVHGRWSSSLQTLLAVAVAVALWRQPFADPALGWALRLGLIVTVLGAFTGGLMTRPTAAQIAEARATHADADLGRPHRRRARRRARPAADRLEHAARRPARAALHRPARVAGAAAVRRCSCCAAAAIAPAPRSPSPPPALYAAVFVALLVQALRGLPVLPL